jgi:serine/threonine protein kinase
MASIAHPHVVPIHAVDEHAGIPYLAMEYVPGGNLESRLQHDGALPILSVIRIAQQVASALGAAHECGLVHRDIKPANILLDRGVDRVRVADFGLVRVTDEASQTRSGLIAGTPQYMSPEQVQGESCDARSDLFALGAMMYALLAGHPPFRAETPYAAMLRIVHEAPRPLKEWRPEVPAWLQSFIGKLMEKRPDDRFASAAEVAHCLEVELAHFQNPSSSQPPPRAWMEVSKTPSEPTPLQRWFSRPSARFGIPVAALGALAITTAWLASGVFSVGIPPWRISGSSSQPLSAPVTQPDPGPIPRPRNPATERLLWSHDGYEELRQRFDALEQSETMAPVDSHSRWPERWRSERWWNDAASLRNELEQAQDDGTN